MRRALAAGLVLLSAGAMIYGWQRHEAQMVFQKAVQICLECIGIG